MAEELADQPRNTAEELADQPPNTAEELADQPGYGAEFVMTDEQNQLRTAVRKFCAENFDEQTVRTLMESDPPFDPKVWARLGAELGVLGLSVPEADGGVGGTLVDQAVAVEELGASLACGPVFGTVFLAIPALVAASAGHARDEVLADLVEGRRTAAFAVPERAGAFEPAGLAVTAEARSENGTADARSENGTADARSEKGTADARSEKGTADARSENGTAEGHALTGTVERVVDAGAADVLLVAARGRDGVALYAVDTSAPGVQRRPLATLDLTRPQATIELTGATGRLVAGPGEADRVIAHALQVGAALLAVEQVGAGQHLLDLSVDYAKSRMQFGRLIGSFQAVKHKLADLLVDLEHARSTAYHAVWALTDGSDDPALAVSIAQATSSAALSRIAADTIQVHGGIGFTWEHQAHLYFKRATTDAALLGTAEQHRSRVAEMVLDNAVADRAPQVADGTPA